MFGLHMKSVTQNKVLKLCRNESGEQSVLKCLRLTGSV